ncbi:MAG: type III PLP-dependent enzyme [Pseudomonadota bacterium]
MTLRARKFLESYQENTPCLVVDLDIVRQKFQEFQYLMPDTDIYYAVKANPEHDILKLLTELGANFDAASVEEVKMCLAAGATADRISYGNTIKKKTDIAEAYRLGVRLFAFDCIQELEKIADVAPDAQVIARILCSNEGADWPLSRKFGCDPDMAEELLEAAHNLGITPAGICFHVGSQQGNPQAWDQALETTATVFKNLSEKGIELTIVNLGGGFPAQYLDLIPEAENYSDAINISLKKHFGNRLPKTIIEPGRALVGDAGVIQAEVVLISRKSHDDPTRWVYLDIGKFGGLAETMDEAIRYPIRTQRDDDQRMPCIIAGPTCDSVDVLYEKKPYPLPVSLQIGDKILIESTGAYTTTYSSVAFNGFAPLKSFCV